MNFVLCCLAKINQLELSSVSLTVFVQVQPIRVQLLLNVECLLVLKKLHSLFENKCHIKTFEISRVTLHEKNSD